MMKYTVYKTVNLVNGKFYIGVHKTDNPNDDYLGSGKFIKRAVAKYGEQNFRKEILAVFEIQREAFDLEKKLVVEAKVDPLCYNLKAGGEGGFDWINRKGLNNSNENGVKGNRVTIGKIKTDPKVKKRFTDRINRVRQYRTQDYKARIPSMLQKWTGQHHTAETKARLSETHKGKSNGRFGKQWMYHLESQRSKPVSPDEINSHIEQGWLIGRRMKF
jgi:hypothetical protein